MAESQFLNRELSWLEFNHRVLEEALDEDVPLLERVKFLAIFSSNLDEFFMVRVARLKGRIAQGDGEVGPDGLTPAQTLAAISTRVHQLVEEQHQVFLHDLHARLAAEGIRRYCHLATGNYNARTSGIYSDLRLFTCRESIGEDVAHLFNLLTGYAQPPGFHHLLVAPIDLRDGLIARIRREVEHTCAGKEARVIAKVNSLVDPTIIEELYAAGQAGVLIDLLVRGICCLRPGVPGLSERIRVISIIDRYLEHARIYYFHNAGEPEYWLSSADWMPRNFDRRVEGAFPVLAPPLQALLHEILEVQLAATVKARLLLPDGSCRRLQGNGATPIRSQEPLYAVTYAGRPAAERQEQRTVSRCS